MYVLFSKLKIKLIKAPKNYKRPPKNIYVLKWSPMESKLTKDSMVYNVNKGLLKSTVHYSRMSTISVYTISMFNCIIGFIRHICSINIWRCVAHL